ncbi:hypothetical protein Q9L58_008404 [Maublancomyces gigas]|uniref:NADP-dependent oxidoreductase domain-containing protein n=1 Tax=Discina gigas TaxID=1032678 RepID=A0ABR3GAW3_9PEZI
MDTSRLRRWMPRPNCTKKLTWTIDHGLLSGSAYYNGINTWDTANTYSNGWSEKVVGKALKTYAIPREKVVIMTKCFFHVPDDGAPWNPGMESIRGGEDYVNQYGLSRSAIFTAVDASLKRLDTDYIDLLRIHRYDTNTPPEETMQAFHYLGALHRCIVQLQHIATANNWSKFVSMQNHYSLLYREEERETIPYCKATGVGLIPWPPLARGHLARSLSDEAPTARGGFELNAEEAGKLGHPIFELGFTSMDRAIIKRVQEITEKKGWSTATVGLAWVNAKVDSPIVGLGSVKRVKEGLEAAWKRLEVEEVAYLEELYTPRVIIGH